MERSYEDKATVLALIGIEWSSLLSGLFASEKRALDARWMCLDMPHNRCGFGEEKENLFEISQVLTAMAITINVFCDVTPCVSVDRYQRFEGSYCYHFHFYTLTEAADPPKRQ